MSSRTRDRLAYLLYAVGVLLFALSMAKCAGAPRTYTHSMRIEVEAGRWDQVQPYVALHATMRIQVATDYVVETFGGGPDDVAFKVVRQPQADRDVVTILCTAPRVSKCAEDLANFLRNRQP